MGTLSEAGLATSFESCSVVTQPLKADRFVLAVLHRALGLQWQGPFWFWKLVSVLSLTLLCSLSNISTGKSKVCIKEDE